MNSKEIAEALDGEPGFAGVFARDQLPERTERPAGLVINHDVSSRPGSHWVCYFISEAGESEYFDPLGDHVPENEIMEFIKRNSDGWRKTVRNNIAFQAEESSRCGDFCIFYLRNRLNGASVCQIHALLSRDRGVNDVIVRHPLHRQRRRS